MVKDVIASYETLINLFERTQFFLQRLNQYITASLTPELTELLAKILAQVLFVLALSTKEMKERRISVLIYFKYYFLADSSVEKFMKRLIGKTEVEDGLEELDMLTKEENLMTAARILGITSDIHHDAKVIKDDTRDIKDDTRDIKDDTRDIKDDTRNISDNLEVNKHGAPHLLNAFKLVLIFPFHILIAIDELQRLLLPHAYRHRLLSLKRAPREPVAKGSSNMARSSKSIRQSQYCM